MAKKDNMQIAHIWANNPSAEESGSNFCCRDGTVFSYGSHFPIARHVTNKKGQPAILFTTASYSNTTSKHISYVRRAIADSALVFNTSQVMANDDKRLANELRDGIRAVMIQWQRARANKEWKANAVERAVDEYNAFLKWSGVRLKPIDDKSMEAIQAEAAKFAAAEKRRKTKEAEATRKKLAADLAAWKKGGGLSGLYGLPEIHLRARLGSDRSESGAPIAGERIVETTRGAQVPYEHAWRAFALVRKCREKHEGLVPDEGGKLKAPGQRRIGMFTINAISPEGTVMIGCHTIHWPEIEDLAKREGWL